MIDKYIKCNVQQLIFLSEIYQFSTLKLKMISLKGIECDENKLKNIVNLRNKSIKLIRLFLDTKLVNLDQSSKEKIISTLDFNLI